MVIDPSALDILAADAELVVDNLCKRISELKAAAEKLRKEAERWEIEATHELARGEVARMRIAELESAGQSSRTIRPWVDDEISQGKIILERDVREAALLLRQVSEACRCCSPLSHSSDVWDAIDAFVARYPQRNGTRYGQ